MSGLYNGRRAPNVSQYLANLNTIPMAQEIAAQNDQLNLGDAGLDFLTNAEFFDFDDFNSTAPFDVPNVDMQKNDQTFQLPDFQAFPTNNLTSPAALPPSPPNGMYPTQLNQFVPSPATGDKRKASVAMPTPADFEDQSRAAAEEDKRRRNTAASARFRVKKKQREQALEKQTKEMSDKVSQLEGKVQALEQENKWLKELITEKSDIKTVDAALERKLERAADGRSTGNRTDGVGTAAAKVEP